MSTPSRVLRKIASRRQKSGRSAEGGASRALRPVRRPLKHSDRKTSPISKRILTPREIEVLQLVANGETDRCIAERLYLSRRTVSCHVSNILDKLNVESRRKAVLTAMRIGLL